jgi:hypothetical protein
VKKSVAGLTVKVDHLVEALGPRAGLDEAGLALLHESSNLAVILRTAGAESLPREKLMDVVDRVARLDVAVKVYLTGQRLGRLVEHVAPSTRPTPSTRALMQEAQDGPKSVTLVECPACADCTLCDGVHMVEATHAAEYRIRNMPTGAPPAKKPKGT